MIAAVVGAMCRSPAVMNVGRGDARSECSIHCVIVSNCKALDAPDHVTCPSGRGILPLHLR